MEGVLFSTPDPTSRFGSELHFTLRAGHQDIVLEGIVRHSVVEAGMGIQFTKRLGSIEKAIDHPQSPVCFSAPVQVWDA